VIIMADRFDLEQQILGCWSVVDDIDLLYHMPDYRELSEDEFQNALLGMSTLYKFKFEQMFNTFEELVNNGRIS